MPAADPSAPSPLGAALERYLRHLAIERGLSANTVAAYRRDLGPYLAALAAKGVAAPEAIAEEQVADFVRARRAGEGVGLAASSTARLLSAIRGFHRFLVEEGLAAVDVTAELRPPKPPRRLPKAI